MSDTIDVDLKVGNGGNWIAKCSKDNHVEIARSSAAALAKMRVHFAAKHPRASINTRME